MKTLHATNRPAYYRTVWISDVHLGFSGCKAEFLLDFLHSTRCDQLYLVGDIIDVWCMKKRLYWPQEHNNVVRTLLGKAKHGTRVVYVPGNHDGDQGREVPVGVPVASRTSLGPSVILTSVPMRSASPQVLAAT
jgi:predicted MPP superfamily phosphohydrolase